MRRLHHLVFQPASRLVRLMLGEKRLACDPVAAEDPLALMPVFVDLDGERREGLWAIFDHLEGLYPENPLVPEDAAERAETLRWLDWTFSILAERVTRKIVYEKANPRFTGGSVRSTPDMNVIRSGREALSAALAEMNRTVERQGNLAGRACSVADFAAAAQLSALDYFGEVPWDGHPAMREWYVRMKSRPSFRSLLADRVPGQPPVAQYAELDF
jgi:glutathione S-transferase